MRKTDPRVTAMESDFRKVFGVARPFTHFEIGVIGFSDGAAGVQWNAWYNVDSGRAYCGVNLEGIANPGWPLVTFIEQELARPMIFCALKRLHDQSAVKIRLWRDVWISGVKHRSQGDELRPTPISAAVLTGNSWRNALRLAWKCTDTEARGRGFGREDIVLLRSGKQKALAQISPHLQFKTPLWVEAPASRTARIQTMTKAKTLLAPIHRFVDEQSRSAHPSPDT
jgi:hypothetical protein